MVTGESAHPTEVLADTSLSLRWEKPKGIATNNYLSFGTVFATYGIGKSK